MNKNNTKFLIDLCFIIAIICVQIFLIYFYISTNIPIIILILNFVLLISYFFISFNWLKNKKKLQLITNDLENTQNYNNSLCKLYDNIRAFKHDFDNIIFTIGGFISNNDIKNLKKYYEGLSKDCSNLNNMAILNPKIINNSGVYNLLIAKYKKANLVNVEIKIECFLDFNKLNMPIYEFTRILGIFIDNAIEAASTSNKKCVNIIFRDSLNNHTQLINIENTYSNKNMDTSKIFEKGISEKENHSGMGLWEVKQILKRNNNVNLITKKDNEYFKQHLEIYY